MALREIPYSGDHALDTTTRVAFLTSKGPWASPCTRRWRNQRKTGNASVGYRGLDMDERSETSPIKEIYPANNSQLNQRPAPRSQTWDLGAGPLVLRHAVRRSPAIFQRRASGQQWKRTCSRHRSRRRRPRRKDSSWRDRTGRRRRSLSSACDRGGESRCHPARHPRP